LTGKSEKNRGIISPVQGRGEPLVGPDALMVMIPSELDYLTGLCRAKRLSFYDMQLYNLYASEGRDGTSVSLCGPFLGAPHAVMGMEKLIALGANRIWILGWCGSLNAEMRVGHLVIPTGALSEEGTSRHYPIGNRVLKSDGPLNQMLKRAFERKGLPFCLGPVWTTDAPYRETPEKVKAFQSQGILAVEMEISALMAVAIYRSVRMAGVLVVSDELFDLTWRPGFSSPLLKESSRAAGKVLLRLAGASTGDPGSPLE
jgi:uridine phosphorylase